MAYLEVLTKPITLKEKAVLCHLEGAGSVQLGRLVKEEGVVTHKIQLIKPAVSLSGFSQSLA